MHLPDGFINNQLSIGFIAIAAGFLIVSFQQVKKSLLERVAVVKNKLALADGMDSELFLCQRAIFIKKGNERIRQMAVIGALIFALQMINFPVTNGTSGHLIGGALSAMILGPWAGLVVISAVLAVQSLIFADGGLLVLGANIINMGVVATVGGYYLYVLVTKLLVTKFHKLLRFLIIGTVAWLTVVFASFFCAAEIGLSGAVDFTLVIPAMVKIHLLIGVGEAIITVLIIKLFKLKFYEE